MTEARERRPRRRLIGLRLSRRWVLVGALVLLALLYYRPVRTYLRARDTLSHRSADVRALRRERLVLERQLADSKTEAALARAARKLGLVKPGEQLFIVKGIEAWRRARRASIGGNG